MSEWKETTLGEILNFQRGYDLPLVNVVFGSYPVISSSGIAAFHNEYKHEAPGVITGRYGTLGELFFIEENYWPHNTTLFVTDFKGNEPKFIYYFLKTLSYYQFNDKTSVPGLNRNHLHELEVKIPPLPEQQSIAAILSSLDNKIDLLRRQNQTLEQLAQTIFKQWFVEFQYPGADGEMEETELGEVPKGWRVYNLGDLLITASDTHDFKNLDKTIFLNTSDILDGQVLHNDYTDISILPGQAKKRIRKDDILYSEIRPENKRFAYIDFDADDYVVSTKLMVLRTKTHVHPIILYTYLTLPETIQILHQQAEARSGTFPQITFSQVEELLLTIPSNEILNKATQAIVPLFKKKKQNEKEIQTLTQLRDSLLPRLMSGRLRVG